MVSSQLYPEDRENAGTHIFKCPLCNNKNESTEEMQQFGIIIPDRDANRKTARILDDQLQCTTRATLTRARFQEAVSLTRRTRLGKLCFIFFIIKIDHFFIKACPPCQTYGLLDTCTCQRRMCRHAGAGHQTSWPFSSCRSCLE